MSSSLLTGVVVSVFTAASVAFYLLPVLIGWARHVPDFGWVVVINILLGWTLAGWVVALALAVRSLPPPGPVVQVVQNLPPSTPPPGVPDGAGWAGPPGPPPSRPDQAPPLLLPPRPADAGQPHSQSSNPWAPTSRVTWPGADEADPEWW